MIVLLLLIVLVIALGLGALLGGSLLIVGLVRKKRALTRKGTILFASTLIGLVGCFGYVGFNAFHEVKSFSPKQHWQAMVDSAFDDTSIRPLDPGSAKQILSGNLSNTALFNGVDVQGVWVEGAVLSYGYFLYAADEKELLRSVASAPINPSFQLTSDTACREVTWEECKDELLDEKGPQRNLPGWHPESVAMKRCYTCLRCPWSHTILIDEKTGMVYHSISEVRE